MNATRPGVLLVTGVDYPEVSGAGFQARAFVRRLSGRVEFIMLTTTADRALPVVDKQDGIDVYRVFIDPTSWWSKAGGSIKFAVAFFRASRRFSIVHLHGFSEKSILLIAFARLAHKKVAIKLTSVGHDDAVSMQSRGRLAFGSYAKADAFFAVSPRFRDAFDAAGLRPDLLHVIPNGVDLQRFRPGTSAEREAFRCDLGLSPHSRVILFVGFFSREKRPDLLFDAWAALARSSASDSGLVFVGATRSPYYEIDERVADEIRQRAGALGVGDRLRFVESTQEIERFHRDADVFVLALVHEGMPNALLEAMATGTACIATRLEGITDILIDDERNGLLVPPDDVTALEQTLRPVLDNPEWAAGFGREARQTVEAHYGLDRTAARYLHAYRDLTGT